jgi:hypothetical protein
MIADPRTPPPMVKLGQALADRIAAERERKFDA